VVISTTFVSILTLLFDLSAIASIGSAVALMIFLMVGIAHVRLIKETGANLVIIYLSIISVVGRCGLLLAIHSVTQGASDDLS